MVEFVSGQQKHPEIPFRRPQQAFRNLKKGFLGNAKQRKLDRSDSLVVSVPLLVRKKETLKPSKGLTDNYRLNRSGCLHVDKPTGQLFNVHWVPGEGIKVSGRIRLRGTGEAGLAHRGLRGPTAQVSRAEFSPELIAGVYFAFALAGSVAVTSGNFLMSS